MSELRTFAATKALAVQQALHRSKRLFWIWIRPDDNFMWRSREVGVSATNTRLLSLGGFILS